jgi:hypothetical protein
MRIAYIAGPYRSKYGIIGIALNIWKARQVAKKYWKKGFAVICPHSNSALFDGIVKDEVFLEGDREFIKRLNPKKDILVLMKDWRKSSGAIQEAFLANMIGINVVEE